MNNAKKETVSKRGRSIVALWMLLALVLLGAAALSASCGTAAQPAAGANTTLSGGSATASTAGAATSAAATSSTGPAGGGTTIVSLDPGHIDLQRDIYSPAEQVLNSVYSSVVNITVQVTMQGQTGGGVGSGIVYTADGLILTNAHVVTLDGQVTSGQQITVTFSDGSKSPASIVGVDSQNDVAAIKVEKSGLRPVTFAASKDVQLAEWAIVIGSPLDFRNSVTLGIVSGLDRTLDTGTGAPPLTGLMQVDTPISPGNSGGGCFDALGNFIGMPEVYLPPAQTGAENIGFCIPADKVKSVAQKLTGK